MDLNERLLRLISGKNDHICGFYWAKWLKADPGTSYKGGFDGEWETVEVFENHINDGEPDQFRVFVGGVEASQSLGNFEFYMVDGKPLKLEQPKP